VSLYRYKAFDEAGVVIEGEVEAPDAKQAQDHVWAQGLTPFETRVTFRRGGAKSGYAHFTRRVSAKDVAAFTREFATLAEADLPLDDSLRLLQDQAASPAMRAIVAQLRSDVLDGRSLSSGLRRFPAVFSGEYAAVVEAGEMSAAPGRVLSEMAELLEKRLELQGKLRSALIYPSVLILMALVSVGIVLSVLIPSVAPIFSESGKPLPPGLAAMMAVQRHAGEILGGAAILCVILALAARNLRHAPGAQQALARLRLKLPVIGALLAKRDVARFARTLGSLRRAGVPVLPALASARCVVANPAIAADLGRTIDAVRDGAPLASSLRDVVAMPPLAVRMVMVGEEAGRTEQMLLRLAIMFDAQTQRAIDRAMSLLTPVLTIVIAAIVGALIMSVMSAILGINELAAQ
jgi:general secretion pathway protein F